VNLELTKQVCEMTANFNKRNPLSQIWHTPIGQSAFGVVCKDCDIIIHEIHTSADINEMTVARDHFTSQTHRFKKIFDERVNAQLVRLPHIGSIDQIY